MWWRAGETCPTQFKVRPGESSSGHHRCADDSGLWWISPRPCLLLRLCSSGWWCQSWCCLKSHSPCLTNPPHPCGDAIRSEHTSSMLLKTLAGSDGFPLWEWAPVSSPKTLWSWNMARSAEDLLQLLCCLHQCWTDPLSRYQEHAGRTAQLYLGTFKGCSDSYWACLNVIGSFRRRVWQIQTLGTWRAPPPKKKISV